MTDPRDFTSIVQDSASDRTGDRCVGTHAAVFGLPCQIEILCSSLRRGDRFADALRNTLGATSACEGLCGLVRCGTRDSRTGNATVPVGAGVPATHLELAVRAHRGPGVEPVGIAYLRNESAAVSPVFMASGVGLLLERHRGFCGRDPGIGVNDNFLCWAFRSYGPRRWLLDGGPPFRCARSSAVRPVPRRFRTHNSRSFDGR